MSAVQSNREQDRDSVPPGSADRRGGPRFHTIHRLARVTRGDDAGLWQVCNISNQGAMLLTSLPVHAGEKLTIIFSDAFAIPARVIWAKDGRCGAAFERPIECETVLQRLALEQRRADYRPLRLDVDARAIACCQGTMHKVRVLNVSRQGVGVAHRGFLKSGTPTRLLFPGGSEHRGVVRWSDKGRAGIYLIDPLPGDQLESGGRV